jgi:uncharacterized membrane protein YkoI
MKTITLILLSFSLSACASAEAFHKEAEQLIPAGKIVKVKSDEKKIQTPAGTIVEIEYSMTGEFKEASGDAALGGDVLEPAGGLLSLKAATEAMKTAGKNISGDWSLEKSFVHGWVYEFEGFENNVKMDYLLDAKTGKILKAEIDH